MTFKNVNKLEMERNFINLTKYVYITPTAIIKFNSRI